MRTKSKKMPVQKRGKRRSHDHLGTNYLFSEDQRSETHRSSNQRELLMVTITAKSPFS